MEVAFGLLPYPTLQMDYSPTEVDDNTPFQHTDFLEEYNLHYYHYYYYNRKAVDESCSYCIRPVD